MGVAENWASRKITDSELPTAETSWRVWNDDDNTYASEVQAYSALMAVVPTTYTFPSGRVAALVNVAISDIDQESWDFRLSYSTFEPKEENDVEYEFEIGLTEVTITHALATSAFTGGGRTAPDFKQGVNVSADGKVQGVSVGQPNFTFSLTKFWPIASVTSAYQLLVKSVAGKYNNATFYGLPAGTVKFLGARGKPSGKKWPITYRFEHIDNEADIAIGDITVSAKLGWQYLDIYRMKVADTSAKKSVEVPHSAYVHTLPPGPGDFSVLGL